MTAPPDAPIDALHAFVRQVRGRVQMTRATESLLAANVTAILVFLILSLASAGGPRLVRLTIAMSAGVVVGVSLLAGRRREWSPDRVLAQVETALPDLRNSLITALELDRHPERASSRIREHVIARAAALVGPASLDAVYPLGRLKACLAGSALITLALASITRTSPSIRFPVGAAGHVSAKSIAPAGTGIARIDVEIAPPAYTGAATARVTNPERLDVLAGTRLTVRVASGVPVTIALGGADGPVQDEGGLQRATLTPATSDVLTVAARRANGEIDRRLVPIVVRPDASPEVTIERPRADLTFETPAARVAIEARASDDLGLASLTLHYTKVTGSGEQYAFREGELPLALTRESATVWRGSVARNLASLDLQDGDLLVYYASAADRRPGAERAVSDSYVIEVGKPKTAIAGGFAVPLEEDRAAISLSALIAKTERTHAAKPRLSAEAFTNQTAGLAVEQRMVRSETLFLMGAHGEVADEEEEAEHSNEIQEGRLENRGQADLREATRLMSARSASSAISCGRCRCAARSTSPGV
jgi:hypothetical protein